jgi:hypothetical protein
MIESITAARVGRRLSWGDRANPERQGTVVKVEKDPSVTVMILGSQGFKPAGREMTVIFDDLTVHRVHETIVTGHAWKWLDQPDKLPELCEELLQVAEAKEAKERQERMAEQEERQRQCKAFVAELERRRPPWAKAALIAEREIDDCDIMTDYFATKTGKRLILAWSKHERDLFPEMRKAAALAEETKHLATAGPEAEHREKYSMGAGYYLKAEGTYSTGWKVEKVSLGGATSRSREYLFPGEFRLAEEEQTETPTKPAEECNGYAVERREYRGHPVLSIGNGNGRPLVSFGLRKAQATLAMVDAIRTFVMEQSHVETQDA